jgi:hypothetical protein
VHSNPAPESITLLTFPHSGARLGNKVGEALAHMPMLKHLSIDFHIEYSAHAWRILAKAPVIPELENLHFDNCTINMHDLAQSLGKHIAQLQLLAVGRLQLINASVEHLVRLYELLSQAPKLDHYYQRSLVLDQRQHEHPTFPFGVWYPVSARKENEDGFVVVYQTQWLRWKGHDEVTEVLGRIARHLLDELRIN